MQGLAKSIAWNGEGATCLIEVNVRGARNEADAAKFARSVASSSIVKAAVYGREPNWGRIACAVGYAGIQFNLNDLNIKLGDILLMNNSQPFPFDRAAASNYLKQARQTHGTVVIHISVGDGEGEVKAWGCDLSYDYVKHKVHHMSLENKFLFFFARNFRLLKQMNAVMVNGDMLQHLWIGPISNATVDVQGRHSVEV